MGTDSQAVLQSAGNDKLFDDTAICGVKFTSNYITKNVTLEANTYIAILQAYLLQEEEKWWMRKVLVKSGQEQSPLVLLRCLIMLQ